MDLAHSRSQVPSIIVAYRSSVTASESLTTSFSYYVRYPIPSPSATHARGDWTQHRQSFHFTRVLSKIPLYATFQYKYQNKRSSVGVNFMLGLPSWGMPSFVCCKYIEAGRGCAGQDAVFEGPTVGSSTSVESRLEIMPTPEFGTWNDVVPIPANDSTR